MTEDTPHRTDLADEGPAAGTEILGDGPLVANEEDGPDDEKEEECEDEVVEDIGVRHTLGPEDPVDEGEDEDDDAQDEDDADGQLEAEWDLEDGAAVVVVIVEEGIVRAVRCKGRVDHLWVEGTLRRLSWR